ncbi:MAG: biotin/lipoyl-binding protein, partial [Pseudomonadota bacterium]
MTVRPTPGKRLSSLTNGLIAPVDRAEFETDPVSRSMLIEERRHTRLARQAVIGCGVLLIILVIWAAIAPVHQVVTGRGEIVPEGLVQPVEHLEGGIVRDILVAPGDPVAAGDALVILDSTATRAELQRAEARRDSLLLSIERQLSLADGGDLVIAGDTVLRRIADSQSDALESASLHRDAQLDVLRAEAAAKEAELRGVLLEQHSNERERAIVRRELADYEAALETGAISRRERDQVARELIALDRDQLRLASSAAALTETI